MLRFFRRISREISINGFTIYETLTVILIISILFSIAIPSFSSVVQKVQCRLDQNAPRYGENMLDILNTNSIEKVDYATLVFGKIKGCEPFGRVLYFYVHASEKKSHQYYYYPITVTGESWQTKQNVIFGAIEDSGKSFIGGCILADPQDPRWDERDSDNGMDMLIGKPVSMKKTFVRQ